MSTLRAVVVLSLSLLAPACLVADDAAEPEREAIAAKSDKVQICHVPPGNPDNRHEIVVGSSAVPAHLAHGDNVGSCVPITVRQCDPESLTACYTGPIGTEGVGVCAAGTKACNPTGCGHRACTGEVHPSTEQCGDGLDNDCNGIVDEGCVCAPDTTAACYVGPDGTAGVGTCRRGVQVCDPYGAGYGACEDSLGPVDELCGDGLDNDCDGATDEGCVCAPGAEVACYVGPPETDGVGVCQPGVRTCNRPGTAFGGCEGMVLPGVEACGNGLDDDCDGDVDEDCPAPTDEVCGDGVDNDFDGDTDERCLGDRAWIDADRDGRQDPGEGGIEGAIFTLRTAAGALVDTTVSDATGRYWFGDVAPGSYYIEVVTPFGYSVTAFDTGGDDTLDSDYDGEDLRTMTFGFGGGTDASRDCGVAVNQHG